MRGKVAPPDGRVRVRPALPAAASTLTFCCCNAKLIPHPRLDTHTPYFCFLLSLVLGGPPSGLASASLLITPRPSCPPSDSWARTYGNASRLKQNRYCCWMKRVVD